MEIGQEGDERLHLECVGLVFSREKSLYEFPFRSVAHDAGGSVARTALVIFATREAVLHSPVSALRDVLKGQREPAEEQLFYRELRNAHGDQRLSERRDFVVILLSAV